MFIQRISLVFERLRVVRTVDVERNTLVPTDADRVIEGSPHNCVTAVPRTGPCRFRCGSTRGSLGPVRSSAG
jgi:catabolite regulation protein CreA